MNKLYSINGASGAGKTTAVKELEKQGLDNTTFLYFDDIGVPSFDDMVKEYGSPEEWQKQTTTKWLEVIKDKYIENSNVVLDLQSRGSFIDQACSRVGIQNYEVILFDVGDSVREQRLVEREQPGLMDENMRNWSLFLKEEAMEKEYEIIDTSEMRVSEVVEKLREKIT